MLIKLVMSLGKPGSQRRKVMWPFRWLYWFFYLTAGWPPQAIIFVLRRRLGGILDILSVFRALIYRNGSNLERVKFMLNSRVMCPLSFLYALKTRGYLSRELSEDWEQIRKEVLEVDGYSCRVCGGSDTELHVDHIVPRQWGWL